MKRMVSSVLACVLLLITIVSPANAASDGYDYAPLLLNENGYTEATIMVDGQPCTVYVSISYSKDEGARLLAYCPSSKPIVVSINTLTVDYELLSGRVTTEQGGNTIATCSAANPSQRGYYVAFIGGMDLVSKFVYASGSATFYADQTVTVSVSAHG